MKLLVIIMLVVLIFILVTNSEDPLFTEIKRRYDFLLKHLPEEFDILRKNRAILTVNNKPNNGKEIAFNVNKGYEIYLCLDGRKINAAMYVLLHELAHITVEEYDHSERFWTNFKKLREHAALIGVYSPEPEMEYCGHTIRDSLFS